MPETTLLGGLVVLDELGWRALWRMVLVMPVTLCAIAVTFPRRWSGRATALILAGFFLAQWGVFILSHTAGSPRPFAGIAGTALSAALLYGVCPFILSVYRDGRWVFLMLTMGTLSFMSDVITTLLLQRVAAFHYLCLATSLVFALTMACFVRFQRDGIWTYMRQQSRGWYTFSSIPLLILGVLYIFRCYPDPLADMLQNPMGLILVTLLYPVIYHVLFRILSVQREQARLERDAALLQMQVRMVEEQERKMERDIRKLAVARHDQRHFLQGVLAYLDAGDAGNARAAVRAQLERGEQSAVRRCEDPVFNQLLSYYAQWAEQEGIEVSVKASLPEIAPERRTELMVALSNTLENAVHACAKVPPPGRRFLSVVLCGRGRQVFLEVKNSYAGKIGTDPDTGLPSSPEPGHGIGFQSMAALAGQPPVWSAENGVFSISLLV